MKNRKDEFEPCPLCGMTDRLTLTQKNDYYSLMQKYGNALVAVRCWRCDLEMHVYSHLSASNNYEILVGVLKEKWGRLKR